MQEKPFVLMLVVVLLFAVSLQGVNVVKANAMPAVSIVPKVAVPEMDVNATVSEVNGVLWVTVDADYQMHTIHGYGDSYLAENSGMGLLVDPSPYVTITVTQDMLEAHYPVPFNVTKLSVKLNDEKIEWQEHNRGFFHIFDSDLQEVNWTVAPVPRDFVVTVHYEHPIPKISEVYGYLGEYAFTLPLYGRYGCSNVSAPLYSWFGDVPRKFNIQIESDFADTEAYAIDSRGILTLLNYSGSTENRVKRIEISQENEDDMYIHGGVVVFNTSSLVNGDGSSALDEQESMVTGEPIPTTVIVVAAVLATVIGLSFVGYFKRRKRRSI